MWKNCTKNNSEVIWSLHLASTRLKFRSADVLCKECAAVTFTVLKYGTSMSLLYPLLFVRRIAHSEVKVWWSWLCRHQLRCIFSLYLGRQARKEKEEDWTRQAPNAVQPTIRQCCPIVRQAPWTQLQLINLLLIFWCILFTVPARRTNRKELVECLRVVWEPGVWLHVQVGPGSASQ